MNRRIEPAERSGRTYDRLTIICPGCQRKQELSTGDSRCEGCGLKFAIRIDEPACQRCGYLLYMLTGDHCPECGEAIVAGVGAAAGAGG